ncbi:CRIB domain-containing protein RIC7-like [Zingiber officinale]|uniref:CRIB domain-containing protein RIC7-like n=1 Tax=Zingiber officinale TaxID=94328 RepID=UPI001C4BACEA|nr:CRIB domain-containing protein RIC7-like [Zingiber officinale]
MGTLVKKGFLKPIRYISQIFDQKEEEMQIGFPTDVKHVAHIGSDGPNSGDASWMKNYHSAPISLTEAQGRGDPATNTSDSQGSEALQDGTKESSIDDEDQDSTKPRHSRRHKSVETLTIDDSEPTNSGVKKGRRGRKKDQSIDQDKDVPAVPKQSRRRSKDDGGSVRSSKSKAVPPSKKDTTADGEKKNAKMEEAITEL